eukprot:4203513-Amphidinium_carterae.1
MGWEVLVQRQSSRQTVLRRNATPPVRADRQAGQQQPFRIGHRDYMVQLCSKRAVLVALQEGDSGVWSIVVRRQKKATCSTKDGFPKHLPH